MRWEDFIETQLDVISLNLPICQDRMEYHKRLMNELECRFGFTLESLEQLWNIYRPTLD
jgi:hypothetical protein